MAAKRCMNAACGAPAPGGEWKKGWGLRSGGFALLCDKCGIAYEQLVFCDIFHQKESGWRECSYCGKRLHCGCIASKYSFDLLDSGGVQCINCMKNSGLPFIPGQMTPKFLPPQNNQRIFDLSTTSLKDETVPGSSSVLPAISANGKIDDAAAGKGSDMLLAKNFEAGQSSLFSKQREIENAIGLIKWEQVNLSVGEMGRTCFYNRNQGPVGSSRTDQQDEARNAMGDNVMCESLAKACLSMSLGIANSGSKLESTSNSDRHIMLAPPTAIAEGRDVGKTPSPQQVQRARHFLSRPPKAGHSAPYDTTKDMVPHMRVARPPAEGRGRNQLLPRYWPRITDQELQQISGDSNSTIVPLFEKVLSASDAGRIGRLVLPKACAEAYFPPISQPEGLPLTIQDAKGKEWHFQFRFWPNNNSRMYVLEGVTPCIQSLQLQAGDTVTFSRIEPEGKLVMGFRKATNTMMLQDSQISAIANGSFVNETFFSGANENLQIVSGYTGILQSIKGAADLHSSSLAEHLNSAEGDGIWLKTDKLGGIPNEALSLQPLQKRSRNIGARRLLMDNEDALELKLTWEEAQDLLRPAPSAKPSIVMIEDHEFEEYEEPPIFGKRTIFTIRASGEQDQWIQCDDCFKWRRVPVYVVVASRWTCADNSWDQKSSSCSVPDELNPKELQNLLRQYADIKRRRIGGSLEPNSSEMDASGLDALATAAALGEVGSQATSSVATTTKHPRHRPGCTCIVCIQPPSGKGPKHNPACTCNVCMTVKRRFKTLMMRKKKRQSEREEAEASKKMAWGNKEEIEGSNLSGGAQPLDLHRENDLGSDYSKTVIEIPETSKGHIDLNYHPGRDEDLQTGQSRLSMMSLLKVANRPLETYLKQNGLMSLTCEQGSSSTITVPQAPVESEGRISNEGHLSSVERERDSGADEGCGNQEKVASDTA
ncbi:B3 domain-containing protein Os07g0679700-like [Typha latifolia]|uniref:B3 domain-containing protein Os07g0679700-like n=1 Tax=Typha latifolia TaxID=4733 RepID=UPI003C2C62D6